MNKELIIVIIIIFLITILEFVTQKYTSNVIKKFTNDLSDLKSKIDYDNIDNINIIDNKKISKITNEIYDNWLKCHDVFSLYIEHTELEKVETIFVSVKSLIETSQYEFAISELEKTIFLLDHISDKYAFNLSNIF